MRGFFVTFEGIEGSGKSTLIHNVANALRPSGLDPIVTREPGGTSLGVALRKVLLSPDMGVIGPIAELMMFAADRAQHVSEVILPALAKGKIVLCDRYSDATVAYQGYGRGIPFDVINVVDMKARDSAVPDLTVLLDLPVEKGLSRVRKRNDLSKDISESRIDEEETAFHQRVRDGYLAIARLEPARFLVLDAMDNPEHLTHLVMDEFRSRYPDEL
jgi:dTMP kinase